MCWDQGPVVLSCSVQFSSVAQSCPTLCDPLNCSMPGSAVHGILQARILEWGSHFLLQGILLTQESNLSFLHSGRFFTN